MRDPDFSGVARAWRLRLTPEMEAKYPAAVDTWIVNGPYHPLWSWWMISAVSLAEMEGAPTPVKQYPEAEYELLVVSLQAGPEFDQKTVDIDRIERGDMGARPPFLTPPDLSYQFDGLTAEQVREIVGVIARTATEGRSIDSDYRGWWTEMLDRTVAHYKAGVH